jgi:hypothetical protein
MKTVTLRAHYDGDRIRLDEPFPLDPGTPLTVVVLPKDQEQEDERESWALFSRSGLEGAFGDDEPEYSLDLIKEKNPVASRLVKSH